MRSAAGPVRPNGARRPRGAGRMSKLRRVKADACHPLGRTRRMLVTPWAADARLMDIL